MDFARDGLLTEPKGNGFLVATMRRAAEQSVAIFGKFPVRQISELKPDSDAPATQPPSDYVQLLQRNHCTLEPLVIAQGGVRADLLKDVLTTGDELSRFDTLEGVELELRWISSEMHCRQIAKAFEPGVLSARPDPMILDGPIQLARWQAEQGHEHVFACVVPVGPGFGTLQLNELLLHAEGDGNPFDASPTNGKKLSPFFHAESQLPLPEGIKHQRYFYSDASSREYARQDWSEDVRIESRVADCSAISLRGYDELGLVIAERSSDPLAVSMLYAPHSLIPGGRREVLAASERAARVFQEGRGDAAVWTPLHAEVDWTTRLLRRRPPLEVRRAMISLSLPAPQGCVVMPAT